LLTYGPEVESGSKNQAWKLRWKSTRMFVVQILCGAGVMRSAAARNCRTVQASSELPGHLGT
jgi:hypothetical protein